MNSIERWFSNFAADTFDPTICWWRFLTCTNKGRHDLEVLGLVFEHKSTAEMHWAPRIEYLEDNRYLPEMIRFGRAELGDDQKSALAEQRGDAQILYGSGSMEAHCPSGCEWRFPRERWDEIVFAARRADVDVDLSYR